MKETVEEKAQRIAEPGRGMGCSSEAGEETSCREWEERGQFEGGVTTKAPWDVQTEMETRTIYIMHDTTRIPKLKGAPKTDEDADVGEWIDDVRRHLKASWLNKEELGDFILQHLAGTAKWEVKFWTDYQTASPESILEIIQTVFGDPESLGALQEAFWCWNQKVNETVLDYLELLKLHSNITKKDKNQGWIDAQGQVHWGVREDYLRRELRSINIQYPDVTFWELRDQAIWWLGEDTYTPGNHKKMTSLQQAKMSSNTTADAALTTTILDRLVKQQSQIDDLMKLMTQMMLSQGKWVGQADMEASTASDQKWDLGRDRQGQSVCFWCRRTGHMVAECPWPPQNRPWLPATTTSTNPTEQKPLENRFPCRLEPVYRREMPRLLFSWAASKEDYWSMPGSWGSFRECSCEMPYRRWSGGPHSAGRIFSGKCGMLRTRTPGHHIMAKDNCCQWDNHTIPQVHRDRCHHWWTHISQHGIFGVLWVHRWCCQFNQGL